MSITINGTTGIAGVDGTASAPSVQGGDTDTGVYFPAANSVGVTTGGVQRLLVQSGDMTIKNRVTVSSDAVLMTLQNDNYGAGPTLGYAYFYMGTPGVLSILPLDASTGGYGGVDISGKFGVNGSYGTAGQVLTSGGSGADPSWATAGPGFASSVVTSKSRATGTSYQNTTTGWLFVAFAGVNNGASATVGASAPGNSVTVCQSNATYTGGSFMVPPGWYYMINYSVLYFVSEGQA